jgi:hypothetical protein
MEQLKDWLKDGGLKSRKFLFAMGVCMLIFAGGALAAKWAALSGLYDTMVEGLVAVTAIYLAGNVTSRFASKGVLSKSMESGKDKEDEPVKPAPTPKK